MSDPLQVGAMVWHGSHADLADECGPRCITFRPCDVEVILRGMAREWGVAVLDALHQAHPGIVRSTPVNIARVDGLTLNVGGPRREMEIKRDASGAIVGASLAGA